MKTSRRITLRLVLSAMFALDSQYPIVHAEDAAFPTAKAMPETEALKPADANQTHAIPWNPIGAKAGADYHDSGLAVIPERNGARLHCVFQRLDGEATCAGLWLVSTVTNQPMDRFRVLAMAVGRQSLSAQGTVRVDGPTVRFARSWLVEEYSVSMDGVRQDFVVMEKPPGENELQVQLAVTGARVEATPNGAQLVLSQSNRKLAYSRLRATDASGKGLPVRIEVEPDVATARESAADNTAPRGDRSVTWHEPSHRHAELAVIVNDTNAIYPVRIDPTFSDANWVSLNPGIPGANDTVGAIAFDGSGNMYVGGWFSVIGSVPVNFIAKWDGNTWSALGSGMNGPVGALAVSGTNLYAAGGFTMAGGTPANGIAKWDGQTWSALGSGIIDELASQYYVAALAIIGPDLYAGGYFTMAGGVAANNIAKWDGHAWSALESGMDANVSALAVIGPNLYAGGGFMTAGGVSAKYVAKWDGQNWSALGSGLANGWVNALAVGDTNLYVGGSFVTAGAQAANLAQWDGHVWSGLGSAINVNGCIDTVAASGTDVYVTGLGVPGGYIAKWDGATWSTLGSGIESDFCVETLAVSGTKLYIGGQFATAGGVAADNLANWDGRNWSAIGSGMYLNGDVNALAMGGTDLYVGGEFTMAGGEAANYVAKWDGRAWSALGSGVNGYVYALAVSGTNLYVGGEFTTAGGVAATNIAKWNGSTWSDLGSAMVPGDEYDYQFYPSVHALALSGNNLYVGGIFTQVGGVAATNVAKWDGHTWSALGPGLSFPTYYYFQVTALAVSGTNLYAGGIFTHAGALLATNIAKWDGHTWSALGSGLSGVNGDVSALAVSGTNLYAGGFFTSAGGVAATNIARWDGHAWSAVGSGFLWGGSGQIFEVNALAVSGNYLYVGGEFTFAGGIPANYIAEWDGDTWSALGSGVSYIVWALTADGCGHLFAGGRFMFAGTNLSPYIAQADLLSPPTLSTPPQTQTAEDGCTVNLVAHGAGDPPPTYQWFFNGSAITACTTNCRLCLPGVQAANIGAYTVVVGNCYGSTTSAPVMLNVIPPLERRPVPALYLGGETGSAMNVQYFNALDSLTNWLPLATVNLTSPPQLYLDASAPFPSERFYRLWQSETPAVSPSLNLPFMVPAITLAGNIGDHLRLDYINQFGPTNAWVTLGAMTLTNSSQLYFDLSAPGQPPRLYRLVPVP